jgi:HEAT repeat protein
MTTLRSWTLRLKGPEMSVEGVVVATDTPPLPLLVGQMNAHAVSEIQIAQGVSAASLMHLMRGLAVPPGEYQGDDGVAKRLEEASVRRIHVLGPDDDADPEKGRPTRVTDAVRMPSQQQGDEQAQPDAPAAPPRESTVLSAAPPPSIDELIDQVRNGRVALGVAAKRIRGLKAGPQLTNGLDAIADGVVKAAKNKRGEDAIEAVLSVIHQEKEASKEDVRICCGVALRRMLGSEILRSMSTLLMDPLYSDDVLVIMSRAGPNATQLLLDQLVGAPTFAERRAYMMALGKLGEGTSNVIAMLNHHQWYVVRNVADLIAELKIEEAIPELGKVADHEDARVRKSVAIALARIGTPAAARHLHTSLRDEDPDVRLTVAKVLGGAGLSGLIMPLANELEREEDPGIREELCRALGRIGTAEAVRTLENVARRKGRMFVQQRPSGDRRAAVEGLALAGGEAAAQVLRELAKDRDKDVRAAAQSGLKSLESGTA